MTDADPRLSPHRLLKRTFGFLNWSGLYAPNCEPSDIAMYGLMRGLISVCGRPWDEDRFWTAVYFGFVDKVRIETGARVQNPYELVPLDRVPEPHTEDGIPGVINRIALEQVIASTDLSERESAVVGEYLMTDATAWEVGERLGCDGKAVTNAAYKAMRKLREVAST